MLDMKFWKMQNEDYFSSKWGSDYAMNTTHPTHKNCVYPKHLEAQRNVVNILTTDFINYSGIKGNTKCNWKINSNTLGYIHILVARVVK